MLCRVTDMRNKEVINICDGCRLGCVDDVEIDTCNACLVAIVIFGRPKCLGLLGREEDIVIGWKDIEVIGEDTVLVNVKSSPSSSPSRKTGMGILNDIFGR